MRELDLLLGSFADANLAGLSEAQLDRYEALLEVPEPQMYAWLTRQGTVPPEWDHDVMRLLLAFQYSPAVR